MVPEVDTSITKELTGMVNKVRDFVTYLQATNPTQLTFATYAVLAAAVPVTSFAKPKHGCRTSCRRPRVAITDAGFA